MCPHLLIRMRDPVAQVRALQQFLRGQHRRSVSASTLGQQPVGETDPWRTDTGSLAARREHLAP
eukprot:3527913-Pleurochrysis_carterae.AAC.3